MKSYNGVAVLARVPLSEPRIHRWCGRDDRRHLAVSLPGGIDLHNIYVPSGGDIPDPALNEKFAHKLAFVEELTAWWPSVTGPNHPPVIALGDFNIAPGEHDVWSHKAMVDVVCHTSAEITRLEAMKASGNFVDIARDFVPPDKKLYSWWSYRARDWAASNRGRRIDHIWVSASLRSQVKDFAILEEARGWLPKPSDHVPVRIDLEQIA
jgi:exodeoxyribonuclease-3